MDVGDASDRQAARTGRVARLATVDARLAAIGRSLGRPVTVGSARTRRSLIVGGPPAPAGSR